LPTMPLSLRIPLLLKLAHHTGSKAFECSVAI
jgi:hypothetical protein